jgi:hypothetical protein
MAQITSRPLITEKVHLGRSAVLGLFVLNTMHLNEITTIQIGKILSAIQQKGRAVSTEIL